MKTWLGTYISNIFLKKMPPALASWRDADLLFLLKRSYACLSSTSFWLLYCRMGNCNKSLSIKRKKLQNCAARILTSSSYDANTNDPFVWLGWHKLNLQRELKTATMVYKSLNGLAPDYLKSMFTDRSAVSAYSLRNCEVKLAIPLPPPI